MYTIYFELPIIFLLSYLPLANHYHTILITIALEYILKSEEFHFFFKILLMAFINHALNQRTAYYLYNKRDSKYFKH